MARGMVSIEEARCKGCGVCVPECPPGILQLSTRRLNTLGYAPVEVTDMEQCTGCAVCAVVCPDVAFTVFRQRARKRQRAVAAA